MIKDNVRSICRQTTDECSFFYIYTYIRLYIPFKEIPINCSWNITISVAARVELVTLIAIDDFFSRIIFRKHNVQCEDVMYTRILRWVIKKSFHSEWFFWATFRLINVLLCSQLASGVQETATSGDFIRAAFAVLQPCLYLKRDTYRYILHILFFITMFWFYYVALCTTCCMFYVVLTNWRHSSSFCT